MEYVNKRKLTLAGKTLLETNAKILDVAMKFGFDSHEGFTRSFKSYMGVTPTEYRKFGLSAIKQKTVKERVNMTYSKTTDEIIRELNDFIAKAKESAEATRKCKLASYKEFWCTIAERTDNYAQKLKDVLERINAINDNPDEITNRFNILRVIDDTAFHIHVMTIHIDVTIARAKPEDYRTMQPICERYRELTKVFQQKFYRIMQFFNELTTLIFEDMRKTFTGKMEEVVRRARTAADMIEGYSYIKDEVTYMANELEAIPIGEITAKKTQ